MQVNQGIMKSAPKVDKVMNKMWKRQQSVEDTPPNQRNITVVTIEDTSTEDSPDQPTKHIEIINLESQDEQIRAETNISNEQAHEVESASTPTDAQSSEEEHDLATTSPAKSSISDLHASDFFNPSEF